MYFRMVSSSRPTVDTKYPRAQKFFPTNPRVTSPKFRAIQIALFPFTNPTTDATEYFGPPGGGFPGPGDGARYSDVEQELILYALSPDMADAFGETDRVLILKKPVDVVEVRQMAHVSTKRWDHARQTSIEFQDLESRLQRATASE